MLKTTLTTVTILLLLVSGGTAQQAPPVQPQAKPDNATPQPPSRQPGQLVNIKLELSITDQRGDAGATPKVVTLVVADRENGRIRTRRGNAQVNIDAHPDIPRDGRIRVALTMEYQPDPLEAERGSGSVLITEALTAILEDGKPMLVSQSADANLDRRVKVELKATVLR